MLAVKLPPLPSHKTLRRRVASVCCWNYHRRQLFIVHASLASVNVGKIDPAMCLSASNWKTARRQCGQTVAVTKHLGSFALTLDASIPWLTKGACELKLSNFSKVK
jgi:hypothetical protein